MNEIPDRESSRVVGGSSFSCSVTEGGCVDPELEELFRKLSGSVPDIRDWLKGGVMPSEILP